MLNPLLVNSVCQPPIYAFQQAAAKLSPKSGRTFDMAQAVPPFPTFPAIRQALIEDLADPSLSFYTHGLGIADLRQAVVDRHPLLVDVPAGQVMITAGANHAMYTALTVLFGIGDEILILRPHYFNYDMSVTMLGLRPRYLDLRPAEGFRLNAEDIVRAIAPSPPQGIILITPNNPTGATYHPGEILRLLEFTAARGVEVIIDETYFSFDPGHLRETALRRFVGRGLSLVGSFSKDFSITGYRVGYFITSPQALEQAIKVQDSMVICAPHFAQRAALHGLRRCQGDVVRAVASMAEKVDFLRREMTGLRRVELLSAGGFFAFVRLDLPGERDFDRCLALFEQTGILGLPGSAFGTRPEDALARLSVCNVGLDDLAAAMRGLRALDDR